MNDYSQNNTNANNENNRYTNQETEKIFNIFLNKSQKLTNSNENSNNTYKNLVQNISHKYKNNYRSLNTEHSKNSIRIDKRKDTIDTVSNSVTKSYLPPINKFNAKVIVENFRQSKDVLVLLDNFIS